MIDKHRIFVGLKTSGHLSSVIPMIKSTVDDRKQLIKWINGWNLHLTLSFIGEITSSQIKNLDQDLNRIISFNSFDITVNGTGLFPDSRNPKTLWLDIIKGREKLINIQEEVESIALKFQSNVKSTIFSPHITIARVKAGNKNVNLDLSTFLNAVYSDIKIPVKTIYLFKSQLLEQGVKYSVISEYTLK
tara:strand:- start:93 stop:659 length:567 start_codon:yes stop_codon:yes gene_type:complete